MRAFSPTYFTPESLIISEKTDGMPRVRPESGRLLVLVVMLAVQTLLQQLLCHGAGLCALVDIVK